MCASAICIIGLSLFIQCLGHINIIRAYYSAYTRDYLYLLLCFNVFFFCVMNDISVYQEKKQKTATSCSKREKFNKKSNKVGAHKSFLII